MKDLYKKLKTIRSKKLASLFMALVMVFQIVLPTLTVYADANPVFTQLNDAGISIEYKITSEAGRNGIGTVSVGNGSRVAITEDSIRVVKIPKTVNRNGVNYEVTGVSEGAFKENTNIETVSLPQTVERIEDSAFKGCENLRDITLQNSITYIGNAWIF